MASINPYDEMYSLLEQQKPKPKQLSQERLKQITRTNAYGEGLRSLSEAITGSMGANIYKRELPKTSLMALNKYYEDDQDYDKRMDMYNNLRLNLKIRDAASQDSRDKQALADRLARDKMATDAAIKGAELRQKQKQFDESQKGLNDRNKANLDWQKSKFYQQQAQKAKEDKAKADKPYFGLWYNNDTVPINETQFYAIADVIRRNVTSQEALKDFDMLMNGFKMGDQTATQQLKLLITQQWSQFPEAMRIGLMNTPYVNDIVQDYSGKVFQPGQMGGDSVLPSVIPQGQNQPQKVNPGAETNISSSNAKNEVMKILQSGGTEKGKRIYQTMLKSGFTKEQAKSQVEFLIQQGYNLK